MIEWTLALLPILRSKKYRIWLVGRFVNTFGSWMNGLAMSWWMLRTTDSPTMVGLVALAGLLPGLIVLLLFGHLFECFPKKKIMLVAVGCMAATSGALAILWYLEMLQPWMVLILAGISGIAVVLEFPAREVFLVDMIGEDFHHSIGTEIFVPNLSRIAGMMLAGIVIQFIGEGAVFAFDAVSSLLMAVTILLVTNGTVPHAHDGDGKISRGKLRNLDVPRVSLLFTLLFGVNLGAVFSPLQTVVVREIYHQDVVEAGLFGMVLGIGSVLGSIVYLLGSLRTKPVAVMAVTALLHALFALGTVASPHFSTSLVSALLLGLFGTWYVNVSKMLIHMAVPHKHRGRAMRLWMAAFGFVPIVGAFAGWLCDISQAPQAVLITFAGLSGVIVVSTIANWAFDKLFKARNGKDRK